MTALSWYVIEFSFFVFVVMSHQYYFYFYSTVFVDDNRIYKTTDYQLTRPPVILLFFLQLVWESIACQRQNQVGIISVDDDGKAIYGRLCVISLACFFFQL